MLIVLKCKKIKASVLHEEMDRKAFSVEIGYGIQLQP